jgi:hypothetical protein
MATHALALLLRLLLAVWHLRHCMLLNCSCCISSICLMCCLCAALQCLMHLGQADRHQHAVCFIWGATAMVTAKRLAMITEHQQQCICVGATWASLRC